MHGDNMGKKLRKTLLTGTLAASLIASPLAVESLYADDIRNPGYNDNKKTEQYNNHPLRIAFASFQDSTGSTRGKFSNLIPDYLLEEFSERGYDVIENDRLRAMLAKKGIKWSDFIDNPYIAIGMFNGEVDLIIFGDYSEPHRGVFRISARYIDTKTGDIKGTFVYKERKLSNFEDDVLPKFAEYLQKDLDKDLGLR